MAAGKSAAGPAGEQSGDDDAYQEVKDADESDDDALYDVLTFYGPLTALAILLVVAISFSLIGWDKVFASVFQLVESSENRALQLVVINLLLITVAVFALPAPAFYMMLNGFFFGFPPGTVINFCALLTAALTSLWLARSCVKERVRRYLNKNPTSRDVMRVLDEDHTGKFLVLFRFVFLPGFVKNYSMAMLDISVLQFVLVSAPGEFFYSSLFAYIGSLAYKVIDKLRRGDVQSATSQFSGFEVLMVSISLLVFILLAFFGWREYNQRKEELEHHEEREPLMKNAAEKQLPGRMA